MEEGGVKGSLQQKAGTGFRAETVEIVSCFVVCLGRGLLEGDHGQGYIGRFLA